MQDVGISYGHLVYFMVIWYIFSRFYKSYKQKSGNPVQCLTIYVIWRCLLFEFLLF
jgi:hypothetical protein